MDSKFYSFARVLVSFIFKILYRPCIVGGEYIIESGPLVLAGNHTSNLDCFLLISSVNRQVHFLGKDSLFKGVLKPIMKLMGVIPVNRKIHDKDALNSAVKCLNNNQVIGIFPEGTINKTSDVVMPFKIGAVKMSKDTGSNIIPFIITGQYKLFRKSIKIEFLKPYRVMGDLELENKKLMSIIGNKILEGKNECN